jgi:hypothetical protein
LTYKPDAIQGVPAGVQLKDAAAFLPFDKATEWTSVLGVQYVSDFVRAKAVAAGIAGPNGAWVVDGDSLWLRRPPELAIDRPPCVGHFFASQRSRNTMMGKTKEEFTKHWELHYLKAPGDRLFLATPLRFPQRSPVLLEWIDALEANAVAALERTRKAGVDYNFPLRSLTSIIQAWGLEGAVVEPDVCSACCRLFPEGRVLKKKRVGETDLGIFDAAICVNNFWQSSKGTTSGSEHDIASLARVEDGSLWDLLRRRAVGDSKRRRLQCKTQPRLAVLAEHGVPEPRPAVTEPRPAIPPELEVVVGSFVAACPHAPKSTQASRGTSVAPSSPAAGGKGVSTSCPEQGATCAVQGK